MRVFRGRAATIDEDREISGRLLERTAETGEPAVRAWAPHRQVAFGRRDSRRDGYGRAREAASEAAFPPVERSVGGRAVAYDGKTTLAFARAEPVADFRRGADERYDRLTAAVAGALAELGVDAETGEPADSFCPGAHSLSAVSNARKGPSARPRRGKLAGIAQRVTTDAALVSGILIVDNRSALAGVLESVYGALEVPFDPDSVGSVAAAGGPADADRVRDALEAALVGDAEPTIERVGA